MSNLLRSIFLLLIVKPLCWLVLGVNLRGREHLPRKGPAILAPNHNSHLDTLMVLSLFSLGVARRVRPVAAQDYFRVNVLRRFVWLTLMGVIPLNRKPLRRERDAEGTVTQRDPLGGCIEALERGEILLIFPEGARGDPEQMQAFKNGIAHLVKRLPETPVIPLFLRGAGKALPRGEALLVPFICDVVAGAPLRWNHDRDQFTAQLREAIEALGKTLPGQAWDDRPTGPPD